MPTTSANPPNLLLWTRIVPLYVHKLPALALSTICLSLSCRSLIWLVGSTVDYRELFEGPVKHMVMRKISADTEIAENFAKVGVVGPGVKFQSPDIVEIADECTR